jgi:uncharacterized protein (TIGR03083 family)
MSDPIAILRASHERLAALVEPLTPDQVTAQAYPIEWSIAQVMSHLGSGAEIMGHNLDAGLAGVDPPGREVAQPIWDAWNSKEPYEQTRDSLTANRVLVERFEALTDDQRAAFRVKLFGFDLDLDGLAMMRLNEHTLHSWDVAVTLDPSATLALDSTALVVDNLGAIVRWTGKASEGGPTVHVVTTSPDRSFTLSLADPVSLTDGEAGSAELRLPAEALVRLVYGRLDPDHTPALSVTGVDLDDLRRTFPGL